MYDTADEIKLVRELAEQIVEHARSAQMVEIKKRWRDSVEMRPNRPPVWCNPVGCWSEMLPATSLQCQTSQLREMEECFKRLLIKKAIGDDTPMNDCYDIAPVFTITPENRWGLDIRSEKLNQDGSAWRYLPALETAADFDKLQIPQFKFDPVATSKKFELYQNYLGDTMKVRIHPLGSYFSVATICYDAAMLRGLEPMMMDMMLEPELLHRLMHVIQQGVMTQLDAIEDSGLLFPNTDNAMLMSDPLNPGHSDPTTFKDCWIHGNSQELDQVSPAMFEEFLLNYQKPIFARFGAVCYGCCENLTHKLDPLLEIPNLKILTCSAWTDLPTLVDKAGKRCCIMWRHKASDVVCPPDLNEFRSKMKDQIATLGTSSYQVVLRELQTLMNHPDRLREWTDLMKEIV